MNTWHQFWGQFFFILSSVLPWFAAPTAGLLLLSLTPMGRALTRYLREYRRGTDVPHELLDELALTRQQLGEVLERLEFMERVLQQRELGGTVERDKPRLAAVEPRVPTPV